MGKDEKEELGKTIEGFLHQNEQWVNAWQHFIEKLNLQLEDKNDKMNSSKKNNRGLK